MTLIKSESAYVRHVIFAEYKGFSHNHPGGFGHDVVSV